jgi:hypothetical protein
MPEVNSPASASPTQMAGMNAPSPQGGGGDLSAPVPGAGSPVAGAEGGTPVGGSSADAKLKQDIQALRSMEASLLEMGQSYPTATKALRSASEAIRSAQRQIVSSPGLAEQPVPNTTA